MEGGRNERRRVGKKRMKDTGKERKRKLQVDGCRESGGGEERVGEGKGGGRGDG